MSAALVTPLSHAGPPVVPGPLRRAATVIVDVLVVLGIVLSIPLVTLALGLPVALFVRFLLWIVGMS